MSFFVDCFIFRRCLAFVCPDFPVQIPCCIALFLRLFWVMVRVVYGVLRLSAFFRHTTEGDPCNETAHRPWKCCCFPI